MSKFKKGQSGNPAGRKPGTGYASKLRDAIESDLPQIIRAMVQQAKDGDVTAAKILLDRSLPALKPMQQTGTVRGLKGKTPTEQAGLIIAAMGAGTIAPDQGQAMLAGIASAQRIKSMDDIEQRLQALENQNR